MQNKGHIILIAILTSLVLFGCQSSDFKENANDDHKKNEMYTPDIFDFAFIQSAPKATKKHDLNDVIKVYLNENDGSLDHGFAIDLQKEHIYVDPRMGSRGLRTTIQDPVEVIGTEGIIEILKKHDVKSWKGDYTFEHPDSYQDGYGWDLWLQYEDGSVEKFKGSGTDVEKLTPEQFDDFVKDVYRFAEGKIADAEI